MMPFFVFLRKVIVKKGDYAINSIYYMANKGIIKGMGDDEYGRPVFSSKGDATIEQALLISVRCVNSVKG